MRNLVDERSIGNLASGSIMLAAEHLKTALCEDADELRVLLTVKVAKAGVVGLATAPKLTAQSTCTFASRVSSARPNQTSFRPATEAKAKT